MKIQRNIQEKIPKIFYSGMLYESQKLKEIRLKITLIAVKVFCTKLIELMIEDIQKNMLGVRVY